jgi:hypothetical protein
MLEMYAEPYFEEIAPADECWFQYSFYSGSMFADSRESVVPRIRQDSSGQKTVTAISFPSTRLLALKIRRKGIKFNQNYFVHVIFPGLYSVFHRVLASRDGE